MRYPAHRKLWRVALATLGCYGALTCALALTAQEGLANRDDLVDVTAEVASGQQALKDRQFSQAMDHFELALRAAPTDVAAHKGEVSAATAWALAQIAAKQTDGAMTTLVRALHVLPQDPELLTDFGVEATLLKQYPIAEQALHAADSLQPHHAKTVYGLARLEVEEQHLPEAERDLKAYLALQPQDASAYFGLGHVYAMEQQSEAARAAFQRSIELKPTQSESYYQLGELDLQAHRDEEARQSFETVLTRVPTHAGALTGLGQIALRAKDYVKAEQYLLAAEKSDPDYQTPHYFRGLALAKLGRKGEADEEMRRGDSRPHVAPPASEGTTGAQAPTAASHPPSM